MPYLYCEKCRGFYELQKGESLDDFDSCECGGKLKYYENMSEYKNETTHKYSAVEVKVPSSKAGKLLTKSTFILLTFTIFPLTLGLEYSATLFIVCAAFGVLLSVVFYYTFRYKEINTVSGLKKIYILCCIYFLSIVVTFLLWISSDILGFIFNFMNNFPIIIFTLTYSVIFLQRYYGNITGLEITDPLESLGKIPKFIYLIGVFSSIVWLLFAHFFGMYFIHTSTAPI